MKYPFVLFLLFSVIIGCSSAKHGFKNSTQKVINSSFYDNQFTGFFVVDSQNNDTLLNFNGKKYFTPASNTKIFTLYAALKLLPERIPALKYITKNDSLFIEGTGDPTLLHSYFQQNNTLDFLSQHNNISLHLNNFQDEKFGPGWAWEDYQYYFQPEKGPFPLYGNVATFYHSDGLNSTPSIFKDSVIGLKENTNRELDKNQFNFPQTRRDTVEIPFKTDQLLTQRLLEMALQKKITRVKTMPSGKKETFYSVTSDTVYKRMMHESDNFLADQMLLLISSTLSDSLKTSIALEYILENQLSGLKQQPRWVDGSGLSRYNLFTPESMVYVLTKLLQDIPRERLFDLFPSGGKGTLKDWYKGDPKPYLFAKTGSVGNNHNISGYLITKSGKTLIFSFMNNHFRKPSKEIKQQMERIFEEIRDTY